MKARIQISDILFILYLILGQLPLQADIAESEPNDPCGTGTATNLVTQNETYTGSVEALVDYDIWYINGGSSGTVTFNVQADLSAQLVLYECDTDYCTDCSAVRTINSGSSNSYTLNASKYYRFEVDQFGGGPPSGSYSVTLSGDASLPVSLISFSAHVSGQSVILQWITESEVDHLGYILERSGTGEAWAEVASYCTDESLRSRGNSSSRHTYSCLDENVAFGQSYLYRLSDVSTQGEITRHTPISVKVSERPEVAALKSAYPNPFNPETWIQYQLHEEMHVTISVYDLTGRFVVGLVDAHQTAGTYYAYWNGTNNQGRPAPSGSYLICMQTDSGMQVQKVLFVK